MREARVYSFRARVFQRARNFRQRPASVAHVVDNQTTAATNVANHVHNLSHVGLLATFVAKSEFSVEPFGVSSSALGATRPAPGRATSMAAPGIGRGVYRRMQPRRGALETRLQGHGVLLLDGATGTELERRGVRTALPLWSAPALLEHPEIVEQIHADYAAAGAELITANTFRTQRRTLARGGLGEKRAW